MENALGIISKIGRYGRTYAHKDIALEFASWLSPEFKLYLITEFERLNKIAIIQMKILHESDKDYIEMNKDLIVNE